jgi:catechol 2,3-dioxygenase-like lactoylglutathione lyase family enzyme
MDHFAVPVSDQERSRRFYESILASGPGRRGGTTAAF